MGFSSLNTDSSFFIKYSFISKLFPLCSSYQAILLLHCPPSLDQAFVSLLKCIIAFIMQHMDFYCYSVCVYLSTYPSHLWISNAIVNSFTNLSSLLQSLFPPLNVQPVCEIYSIIYWPDFNNKDITDKQGQHILWRHNLIYNM